MGATMTAVPEPRIQDSAIAAPDWTRVAYLLHVSRGLDQLEEKTLVPAKKVAYQFSARGHDFAQIVLGQRPRYVVATYDEVAALLAGRLDETAAQAQTEGEAAGDDDVESLRDLASGAPVVRALNDLFERAVEARATDLHIEPMRDALSVRLRVDGVLRPTPAPPSRQRWRPSGARRPRRLRMCKAAESSAASIRSLKSKVLSPLS